QAAYDAGTVGLEQLCAWSRRWLQALLDVAKTPDNRIEAYQAYFNRMQQLHEEVAAKYRVGAKGGETDRFCATQFYLAEAKLWLSREKINRASGAKQPATAAMSDNEVRVEDYQLKRAKPEAMMQALDHFFPAPSGVYVSTIPGASTIRVGARPSQHQAI